MKATHKHLAWSGSENLMSLRKHLVDFFQNIDRKVSLNDSSNIEYCSTVSVSDCTNTFCMYEISLSFTVIAMNLSLLRPLPEN